MPRENLNFYDVEETLPSIYKGILTLREDFDSHIHDGTNSREFDTLHVRTLVAGNSVLAVNSLAVTKKTYADDTNGFWVGLNSGVAKMYLGNATNYLKWTGTAIQIAGSITATSGSIGSFTIGTYLYTGSKTAYNDTNTGVHLGSDGIGIGNNVFTVSSTGALVATSATITGTINATAGKFGTATNYWSVGATGLTAVSASTDVIINYGKTDFGQDSTAGFILGYDYSASASKFEIGSSTSKIFKYDGTDFTLIGGTITGGILQTATSGQRIVVTGATNEIKFYNSSSTLVGSIYGTASVGVDAIAFYDGAGSPALVAYFGMSAGNLVLAKSGSGFVGCNAGSLTNPASGFLRVNSHFEPSTDDYHTIGGPTYTWVEGYINKILGYDGTTHASNVIDLGNVGYIITNQLFVLKTSASDPGVAVTGGVYMNTNTGKLKFYDGANWRTVTST